MEDPRRGIESTLAALAQQPTEIPRGASDPMSMAETLAAPPTPRAAASGKAIVDPAARFETLGVLGEGGMGRVDRVRDRDLLREIAVKHLKPDVARDEGMLEQFLWEARVTAYLDHPNIVPVHDLGVSPDGQLSLTMKLVRGTSLDAALAKRARAEGEPRGLHLSRRLRVFLQICHAISFAHARGVLHRDIKPANVLLGEHGEVLVTDWGIAIPLPDAAGDALRPLVPSRLSMTSVGTPMYMSPEQARGEALDARSDVFALGAVLYELVALRRAFDAESVPAILERVKNANKVPLLEAAPGTGSALVAIVDKATALDRDQRYSSVHALAEDVEAALDGRTPAAEHAPLVTQAARYYVSRDPAMARLRVVDIDMWAGSASLVGAGLGVLARAHLGVPWWPLVLVGFAVALPPTRRWLRERRGTARERTSDATRDDAKTSD
jgi:eukaryotic-like serine/threonine-protein kinase